MYNCVKFISHLLVLRVLNELRVPDQGTTVSRVSAHITVMLMLPSMYVHTYVSLDDPFH